MSDSKNPSTTTQQDSDAASTFSHATTLQNQTDASSIYTVKPTLSTIAEDGMQEKNSWKTSVKAAYLKFESKTPHGKDRQKNKLILQQRKKDGVDENYKPNIMFARPAAWSYGSFSGI